MEVFKKQTKIDFLAKRNLAFVFSGVLVLISIVSLATRGLNFGLDFTGGTLIELGYEQPVDLAEVRQSLEKAGFKDPVVQHFGTVHDVMIRLAPQEGTDNKELSTAVVEALKGASSAIFEIRRVEFVGPQVGEELAEDGGLAVLYAMICIFIYVFFRFEWRFSAGAVVALFHDVIITLGVFSVLGMDFDLTVLAAILAIIGYSLNDTIVVFDRIRDNFRKMRKETSVEIMNSSMNQTLSRTIMTSFVTLLTVIALFFFGGELLRGFSSALIVGIVIGTYSSIYIASALALLLGVSRSEMTPVKKEAIETESETP
ncbi:MAG TPA: protein translocase subunit SecF [Gammaproteobacteria bacterium]